MKKEIVVRVIAMPKDSNADGDVFGGWILSQMDLAGGAFARKIARGRVVTVSIDNMIFHLPVFIGDYLECCVELVRIGNSSITVNVESFVERKLTGKREKVTEGKFVFVAIDEHRRPRKIENPAML